MPDLSPIHHAKEKTKIGHSCLRKSVISLNKSEAVSVGMSQTGSLLNHITILA